MLMLFRPSLLQVLSPYPYGLLPALLLLLYIVFTWVAAFIGVVFLARLLLIFLTGLRYLRLYNLDDILLGRRGLMFGRKKSPEPCSVCGKPSGLTKTTSKMDPNTSPGVLQINQHKHPMAKTPFSMYLCDSCLDTVSEFIVYLIDETEKNSKQEELLDKLKSINVGVVLTVVEEHPHPMPDDEMKHLLENTPFSGIWKQRL